MRSLDQQDHINFTEQCELSFFKNKNGTLVSRLTNGKIVLLDRSEKEENVVEGIPYLCSIKHLPKVAFAKIINKVFLPRVLIAQNGKIFFLDQTKEGELFRKELESFEQSLDLAKERQIKRFEVILGGI